VEQDQSSAEPQIIVAKAIEIPKRGGVRSVNNAISSSMFGLLEEITI
ncbi:uncharacterized protein METZ01_LOCUS24062, partial [marine metagenome]